MKTLVQSDLRALNLNEEVDPFDLETFLGNTNQVAVTIYVQFLKGNKFDIIDRDTMIGCLRIYSLTEDRNFFRYILSQLFTYWTLLSVVLKWLMRSNMMFSNSVLNSCCHVGILMMPSL